MAVVLLVTSDTHCRSTVGLIHPNGVDLSDDGHYTPSPGQRFLWDVYSEGIEKAGECAAKNNADLFWISNGDLVDGYHHGTHQVISNDAIPEREIVRGVLDPVLDLDPKRIFIVKGTEAHVGKGGSSEESIARALSDDWPVEKDINTNQFSWYTAQFEIEDVLIDATHHGRTGYRPWTEHNAVQLLAANIFVERAKHGERIPQVALRSHFHRHFDSHDAWPVRVLQTAAFQLGTSYVKAKVPESLADIGLLWILVDDDHYEVHKHIVKPSRGKIWRAK